MIPLNMLRKFFGTRTHKPPSSSKPVTAKGPAEGRPWSALKIIHAGGKVESYYMAIPAKRILDKHPSFTLARPEIFRRPWDSIVKPEEILVPGQKFFLVPNHTVRKLRRKIRKPIDDQNLTVGNSFVPELSRDVSAEVVSEVNIGFSKSCSILCTSGCSKSKRKSSKARVRFVGVDGKHRSGSGSLEKKKGSKKEVMVAERRRKVQSLVLWQPSLTAIDESHSSND